MVRQMKVAGAGHSSNRGKKQKRGEPLIQIREPGHSLNRGKVHLFSICSLPWPRSS